MRMLVVATVLAAASIAHAEPKMERASEGWRAGSDDLITRALVLDAQQLEAQLGLEMNLQVRRIGQPLSLAPDLWYGVTRRWTVGLIHGNQSVDRIEAGATFCVRHLERRCETTYHGSGLDVRWSWREGPLAIAPRARLLLREIDPIKPALTLGALVRWTRGRFMVASDPYLRLGLANRDLGNRAALMLPVWLGVQPTCRWLVALHTGVDGDVATWRDGWHVPFALLVRARATTAIDVSVEAGFPSLLGPQNNYKTAAAIITVGWRSN